ncbi:hypothetical protein HPB47_013135 [Ixodes persulcatus]|uniref:Uncharacterized protein n=1 Tax=Ixodes persulcatus TaxID=34615 RepID=A0AC60NRM1_IXOPE|nr:hypothetical protein HPB47_013135 [Ixodes persulcatus]
MKSGGLRGILQPPVSGKAISGSRGGGGREEDLGPAIDDRAHPAQRGPSVWALDSEGSESAGGAFRLNLSRERQRQRHGTEYIQSTRGVRCNAGVNPI